MASEVGADRVIVAKFMVDESESQTDYYGGRSARKVVIGFGKGKRESFKQLRQAAELFAPTAMYAPGNDRYELALVWDHNFNENEPGRAFIEFDAQQDHMKPREGHAVPFHWYSDKFEGYEKGLRSIQLWSKKEVDLFLLENPALRGTRWDVRVDSYENRENYSMGGGNYLGSSRYSGWKVYSELIDYAKNWESIEFFNPPAKPKSKKAVSKSCKSEKKCDLKQSKPRLSDVYAALS